MASLDVAFGDTKYRPGPDVVGQASGLIVQAVYDIKFDGTNYYRSDGLKLPPNIREISLQGQGWETGLYEGYFYSFFR